MLPADRTLAPVTEPDLPVLRALADTIWRQHYAGIISAAQIDYMLAGKPIVASYTGYPSMINEAQCGTYVPAGDMAALRAEILSYAQMDSQQREAMGLRGREWIVSKRRYETLAQDYLKILFPVQPGLVISHEASV